MNVKYTKQKWKRWLEEHIFPEIRYLTKLKIVRKKLDGIFFGSQEYPKRNFFYWYLAQAHAASIVSGVYRLVDKRKKKDYTSLLLLLYEVKDYPKLVSRRAYTRVMKKLYRDKYDYHVDKRRLHEEFTSMAGKGQYINVSIINKDIKQIESMSKKIITFRHKFIGHHAHNQKRYKAHPTIKEVHDCIDKLAEISKKYHQLITGSGGDMVGDWTNDIENDITDIFK